MRSAPRILRSHAAAQLDKGKIALRPSYPVAFRMALAIPSFAASLGYSHFLLQPSDEQAAAITEDALASLEHLANMPVELARGVGSSRTQRARARRPDPA